jgi:hypothetical protein
MTSSQHSNSGLRTSSGKPGDCAEPVQRVRLFRSIRGIAANSMMGYEVAQRKASNTT